MSRTRRHDDERASVTVAVPTFQRTQELDRLLSALPATIAHAEAEAAVNVRVLIVDNDPGMSAQHIVRDTAGLQLTYMHESTPGVVAVRNRALEESADDDVLVFIDDDETPSEPSWLSRLLAAWRAFDADVVAGPVRTVVESEPDPWIESGRFYARGHRSGLATGEPIQRAATNNLLLDMEFVQRHHLRFDPRFGRTGGEDSLFTAQAHQAGARMVWCAEALVTDHLLPGRQTRSYALERTRSMAAAGVDVSVALAEPSRARVARVRFRAMVAGGLRIAGGCVGVILGWCTNSVRRDALGRRRIARGRGAIEAAAGVRREVYGATPDAAAGNGTEQR